VAALAMSAVSNQAAVSKVSFFKAPSYVVTTSENSVTGGMT